MKRIAIFLSAASLAVTGMISCEKEPDTEAPVPVDFPGRDEIARRQHVSDNIPHKVHYNVQK